MEIGALNSLALSSLSGATSPTEQAVGMVMLGNQLDATDEMSSQMIKMMENSVNPAVGGNFDMSV